MIFLIFCLISFANEFDYGSLYILDQNNRDFYSWRFSTSYGYEFGNFYFFNYPFSLSLERHLGKKIWIGVQSYLYDISPSPLARQLESFLTHHEHHFSYGVLPKNSFFLTGSFMLFKGYSIFIHRYSFESEIFLKPAVGWTSYVSVPSSFSALLSLQYHLRLKNWIFYLGFLNNLRFSKKTVMHYGGDLGVSYAFNFL